MTTESNQALETLLSSGRDAAKQCALPFRGSPLPMAVCGQDGLCTDVNDALLDILLRLREEIVGRSLAETGILPEAEDVSILEELADADSPLANREIRMRRGDGLLLDCLVSASPVFHRGKKETLIVVVDETESKRALRRLEDEAARFRFLADHVADVVWMVDMTMQPIYFSPSVEKLLGFTPEEAMEQTMEEAFTREALERSMQVFADGMQLEMSGMGGANHSWKMDMEMYHKNGAVVPVEVDFFLQRDKEGAAKYILANAKAKPRRDSGADSDHCARQTLKAESLERMAGAIAHNFNNLLGVVQGNLELAGLLLPGESPAGKKLAEAMKATLRAAEISSLMLMYTGKTTDRLELLDLSEECRRGFSHLQNAHADAALLIAHFPQPGPLVKANPLHIARILANLVANAVESLSCGGKIVEISVSTVSAAAIPSRRRCPTGWEPTEPLYACLKVQDEGCGIAENDIEKLFDPFFSTKFTGRGLGLPVVLGTARAKGGCVAVESEPGKGSVFGVYLPIATGDIPARAPRGADAGESVLTGAVLVVDDEPGVRQMAGAMLEHLGFSVIEAGDGFEALEVFRRNRREIRCVISDLTMPRMGGWEFIEALRLIVPGMPVILVSGYDEARVMVGARKELPQAFLGKPYGLKDLRAAVHQALKGGETGSIKNRFR